MKNILLTFIGTLLISLMAQAQSSATAAVSGAPEMPCEGVCEAYKSSAPMVITDTRKYNKLLPDEPATVPNQPAQGQSAEGAE